jgi:META domain
MKLIILIILLSTILNCKSKIEDKKIKNSIENEATDVKNVNQILNRVWMLIEFGNFSKELFIEKKAFLDLTTNSASMGCNSIGFNYKKKSVSEIEFSNLIRTEMAYGDMTLEDDFLKTIPVLNSYKIDGHKLTLYNSQNKRMVFVAQDWD